MDAGDWIALAAVFVATGAAAVSIHQARSAKESAQTARGQADAAHEANRLTRQQMAQQATKEQRAELEGQAAAFREAEAVHLELGASGGSFHISVQNNGGRPISHVQLMDVRADEPEPGPWRSWTPNPHVGRQLRQVERRIMQPGDSMTTAVWLTDDQGRQLPLPGLVRIEVRFRDADGQWWMTELTEGPRRIDAPAI
ncbi:hypothetical protein [Streptomyces sp. NPDC000961]|uniref:hypothetical protein n=1 Tax=Streptomyces sp. NPDC000961 TaxID=3364541 RepID=UPI0036A2FAC9